MIHERREYTISTTISNFAAKIGRSRALAVKVEVEVTRSDSALQELPSH